MWGILSDPTCQFIIVILLTIAAIVVSVIIYLKQRQRRSLSYEIVSATPLLSVEEDIKKDLQISYKGKPVEQVHLVMIKILNSGSLPIPSKDYEQPITLSFGNQTKILTAEIAETNPDSLEASIDASDRHAILVPALLNQKDFITIKMLVTKYRSEPNVSGRIIGVKEIRKVVYRYFRRLVLIVIGGVALDLICVMFYFYTLNLPLAVSFLSAAGLIEILAVIKWV